MSSFAFLCGAMVLGLLLWMLIFCGAIMHKRFFCLCVWLSIWLDAARLWSIKFFLWLLSDSFDFNDIKDM